MSGTKQLFSLILYLLQVMENYFWTMCVIKTEANQMQQLKEQASTNLQKVCIYILSHHCKPLTSLVMGYEYCIVEVHVRSTSIMPSSIPSPSYLSSYHTM